MLRTPSANSSKLEMNLILNKKTELIELFLNEQKISERNIIC